MRAADDHAHKPLRLCADGRRWRRLLELRAVATSRRRATGSLLSKPRSSGGRRKKNMIHELEKKDIKVLQFKSLN